MKTVTKTADYTIFQKKSGRYAVLGSDKKYINGDDKARILVEAGLVKVAVPAKEEPVEEVAEAPAEEAASEEAVEEGTDADEAAAEKPAAESAEDKAEPAEEASEESPKEDK